MMNIPTQSPRYIAWLVATRDLSAHTVRAYASDVAALGRYLGPDFNLAALTIDHTYAYLEHLQDQGHATTTIRRRLCGVRSFVGWLQQERIVDADPLLGLNVRFARPRRLPRALSESDSRRLIAYLAASADQPTPSSATAHTRRTTLLSVLLMIGTGIRVGELTQLRVPQIDLPARTVRVLGKGRRERMVYLPNDAVADLIDTYIADRFHHPQDAHLLLNRHGEPLSAGALRTRLRRAGEAAGLPNKLTPHMLRHTAATQLVEAGVDIRFVQRLLGHASLTTTEIYTHVADRSLRQAVLDADVLGRLATSR